MDYFIIALMIFATVFWLSIISVSSANTVVNYYFIRKTRYAEEYFAIEDKYKK